MSSEGKLIKYDFIILSKVDKDGACNLLHTKPLFADAFYQPNEIVLSFSEGETFIIIINSLIINISY